MENSNQKWQYYVNGNPFNTLSAAKKYAELTANFEVGIAKKGLYQLIYLYNHFTEAYVKLLNVREAKRRIDDFLKTESNNK